jgi:drug/metabolite transporter (DMT)-like permease
VDAEPPGTEANRLVGVPLAIAGVLVLSPDALIIRLVDESPWVVLFWRGVFTTLSLTVVVAWMSRGHIADAFRRVLPLGFGVAALWSVAQVCFVGAVSTTDATNALVIFGSAPLFAAIFSRAFLGEHIPGRTWVAIACVFVGVGLVFAGTGPTPALVGDVIALVGSLCSAGAMTLVRRRRDVSMIPSALMASAVVALVASSQGSAIPSSSDLALLIIQGCVVGAGAMALLVTALRYMPAPEVSLISRGELLLGPLWLWVVLGEVPTPATIVSGVIIGVTLTVHTILGIRADREASRRRGQLAPVQHAPTDQLAPAQELVDP